MTSGGIGRLYFIIRVFFRYGLDELIPHTYITLLIRLFRRTIFWLPNYHKNLTLGMRLRMALEELGPVWIKFGQMISTRRDLCSSQIADQLAILQDHVTPFDGMCAKLQIERSLGGSLELWFDDFNIIPLASASIAQVHTAILKENGTEVVIKVIRPDILPVIQADMQMIYLLANWIKYLIPESRRLHPTEVVADYEKSLLNELNLLREAANAIQLRRNFEGSNMLYVPEVYPSYCSESILVMERIYGIPINDILALEHHGVNMRLLAERGVHIFFTQVFRDSFFHADMHPGNIFVSYEHPNDPLYIGIDFGIVGSLNKTDKRYLAENFIAFFNRDYRKIAELHIDSGWVPANTSVENFECAIRTVCEPIFDKPLAEISFSHVLLNLFNTARHFSMEVLPQLVLLQKTLLYIEGIGRQIYPQLDLWKTAKPFFENWINDQISIKTIFRIIKEKTPLWIERLPDMPDLIYDSIRQHKRMQSSIERLINELSIRREKHHQSYYFFSIGAVLLLGGIALLMSHQDIKVLPTVIIIAGLYIWIGGWRRLG